MKLWKLLTLSIVVAAVSYSIFSLPPVPFIEANAAETGEVNDKPSSWAEADIDYMIKEQIVPVELQKDYNKNITRAEYTLLVESVLDKITGAEEQLHKVLTEHKFEDSFDEHVYTAYIFGIVNGVTDTQFEPTRAIARKEAVMMMGNILKTLQVKGLSNEKASYVDYSVIPAWAQEAANITYNAKIFQGSDAGMEPDKPYTRQQAIVTMKRLLDFAKEVNGISYRGKVFIEFGSIDDVRVGKNYVKIGSPKGKANFNNFWSGVSNNFPSITLSGSLPEKVTSEEFTIETIGEDYLIKISW